MTREEAQKILATWLGADVQRGYIERRFDEDDVEAFRMAIEALKAPTENINKADAIDAINARLNCASDTVIVLPSAEPKTGEWVKRDFLNQRAYYICSLCGRNGNDYDSYCPNCGAKMKGGAE